MKKRSTKKFKELCDVCGKLPAVFFSAGKRLCGVCGDIKFRKPQKKDNATCGK